MRKRAHHEHHRTQRIGWLRAAVLGANDGIVSTASLMLGVAAANTGIAPVLLAGVAGLVAGAMSMAAGEYVSVHSQSDSERADIERELREITANPVAERDELASIYTARGLEPALAQQVADQLTAHDALGAHVRDELGFTPHARARPLQAAFASAASFSAGAGVPLVVAVLAPASHLRVLVAAASLLCLALTGAVAARAGGASVPGATARVTFWGALAMAVTTGVGALFHVSA